MGFSKIDNRRKRAGQDKKSELLKNVHQLADYFMRSVASLQAQDHSMDKSIAGNALVAATLAERRIGELSERIRELEKLAMTDELTGLMNRRGFETEVHRVLSSATRHNERGVLIYIDLDEFKPVNDQYGHAAGDEVLRHVGQVLAENIRDSDYICRLGGDEFAVLMPRTAWKNGLSRAGIIENRLNTASTIWQKRTIRIQASLGLQSYRSGDCPSDLLIRADKAMYKTKKYRASLAGGEMSRLPVKDAPAGRPTQYFLHAAS